VPGRLAPGEMDVGRNLTDACAGGGGVSAVGDDGDRVVSASSSSSESEEEEERVAVDVALMLSSTSCKKCVADPKRFRLAFCRKIFRKSYP
jgi:hypothetical protein